MPQGSEPNKILDENMDKVNSETKMATYAEITSGKPNLNKENFDDGLSTVKPIFILERDLFGALKPQPKDFLSHEEIYKGIDKVVPATHLKGLQRVGGLWRIYLDNENDKDLLLIKGITIRKKLLTLYSRNPFVVEREKPNYLKVRIKGVPLSADDGQLFRYLELLKVTVHSYHRERLRVNGFLTNCQTGDRIFLCDQLSGDAFIPKICKIGKYRAVIIYSGQRDNSEVKCNKCLKTGHKIDSCTEDWICRKCKKSGHKSIDCHETNEWSSDESDTEGDQSTTEDATEDENEDTIEPSQLILQPPVETNTESAHQETTVDHVNKSPSKGKEKKKRKPKSKKTGPLDQYIDIKETPNKPTIKRKPTTPTDQIHERDKDITKPKTRQS